MEVFIIFSLELNWQKYWEKNYNRMKTVADASDSAMSILFFYIVLENNRIFCERQWKNNLGH